MAASRIHFLFVLAKYFKRLSSRHTHKYTEKTYTHNKESYSDSQSSRVVDVKLIFTIDKKENESRKKRELKTNKNSY